MSTGYNVNSDQSPFGRPNNAFEVICALFRSLVFCHHTWPNASDSALDHPRPHHSTLKRTSDQLMIRSKRLLSWALESRGAQFDVNQLLIDALLLEGTCDGNQIQVRPSLRYFAYLHLSLQIFHIAKCFILVRHPIMLFYLVDVYLSDNYEFQIGGTLIMCTCYLSMAVHGWQMHRINRAYQAPFHSDPIAVQSSSTSTSGAMFEHSTPKLKSRHALSWIRPLLSTHHRRSLGLSALGERQFVRVLRLTHRWTRPGTTWSALTGYSCVYYTLVMAFVRLPLVHALFVSLPFTFILQLSLAHFWAAVWATYAVFLDTCFLLRIAFTDCARRFRTNRVASVRAAMRPMPHLLVLFASADEFFAHTVCVVQFCMMIANIVFVFMIVMMPALPIVRFVFLLSGISINLALILPIFVLNTLVYNSVRDATLANTFETIMVDLLSLMLSLVLICILFTWRLS
jgi:hypothetical protein